MIILLYSHFCLLLFFKIFSFQLFILRVEAELQASSCNNLTHNLQLIDSLKKQVSCLFGGCTVKAIPFPHEKEQHEHSQDAIFKPRKVSNQVLTDVKYKGDWMKRPISDNEVAWLAKLLVGLSGWLNENLGLNQAENSDGSSKWPYLEVASGVENVSGSSETIRMMLCAIGSWFLALGATVVRLMRKHGLRVNLRILASKKIVLFFIMSVLFRILKIAFGLFHRV